MGRSFLYLVLVTANYWQAVTSISFGSITAGAKEMVGTVAKVAQQEVGVTAGAVEGTLNAADTIAGVKKEPEKSKPATPSTPDPAPTPTSALSAASTPTIAPPIQPYPMPPPAFSGYGVLTDRYGQPILDPSGQYLPPPPPPPFPPPGYQMPPPYGGQGQSPPGYPPPVNMAPNSQFPPPPAPYVVVPGMGEAPPPPTSQPMPNQGPNYVQANSGAPNYPPPVANGQVVDTNMNNGGSTYQVAPNVNPANGAGLQGSSGYASPESGTLGPGGGVTQSGSVGSSSLERRGLVRRPTRPNLRDLTRPGAPRGDQGLRGEQQLPDIPEEDESRHEGEDGGQGVADPGGETGGVSPASSGSSHTISGLPSLAGSPVEGRRNDPENVYIRPGSLPIPRGTDPSPVKSGAESSRAAEDTPPGNGNDIAVAGEVSHINIGPQSIPQGVASQPPALAAGSPPPPAPERPPPPASELVRPPAPEMPQPGNPRTQPPNKYKATANKVKTYCEKALNKANCFKTQKSGNMAPSNQDLRNHGSQDVPNPRNGPGSPRNALRRRKRRDIQKRAAPGPGRQGGDEYASQGGIADGEKMRAPSPAVQSGERSQRIGVGTEGRSLQRRTMRQTPQNLPKLNTTPEPRHGQQGDGSSHPEPSPITPEVNAGYRNPYFDNHPLPDLGPAGPSVQGPAEPSVQGPTEPSVQGPTGPSVPAPAPNPANRYAQSSGNRGPDRQGVAGQSLTHGQGNGRSEHFPDNNSQGAAPGLAGSVQGPASNSANRYTQSSGNHEPDRQRVAGQSLTHGQGNGRSEHFSDNNSQSASPKDPQRGGFRQKLGSYKDRISHWKPYKNQGQDPSPPADPPTAGSSNQDSQARANRSPTDVRPGTGPSQAPAPQQVDSGPDPGAPAPPYNPSDPNPGTPPPPPPYDPGSPHPHKRCDLNSREASKIEKHKDPSVKPHYGRRNANAKRSAKRLRRRGSMQPVVGSENPMKPVNGGSPPVQAQPSSTTTEMNTPTATAGLLPVHGGEPVAAGTGAVARRSTGDAASPSITTAPTSTSTTLVPTMTTLRTTVTMTKCLEPTTIPAKTKFSASASNGVRDKTTMDSWLIIGATAITTLIVFVI